MMVPGQYPIDELETALLRVAPEPLPPLVEHLTADDRGLRSSGPAGCCPTTT